MKAEGYLFFDENRYLGRVVLKNKNSILKKTIYYEFKGGDERWKK